MALAPADGTMIRKERLTALLQRLVQTSSENPPGNEEKISKIIEEVFSSAGLDVRKIYFEKNRPNVLGILKGKSSESPLVFIAHSDTVPAGRGWDTPPFSGKIKNGKLYGRGATDDKCHVAMLAEVAKSLNEDRVVPKQDILFLAMADEESGGGAGLIPLLENKSLPVKEAVILDGDGFEINIAQKGLMHAKATVFGTKAHGAYPHLGRSAIEDCAKIICDLKDTPISNEKHPLLGEATINIGTIYGGERVNIVADNCVFEIDARFAPPISCNLIKEHMNKVIGRHSEKYKLYVESEMEPVQIDEKDSLVTNMCLAIRDVGREPKVGGSAGSTLLAFLVNHGINGVSLGFGTKGTTHATNEYVIINDVFDGARTTEHFIKKHIGLEKR